MTPTQELLEALKAALDATADSKARGKLDTAILAFRAHTERVEPVAYIRKDQLQKAAQSALLCEVTPEPRQDRIGIYTNPPAVVSESVASLIDAYGKACYEHGIGEVKDGHLKVRSTEKELKKALATECEMFKELK